METMPAGGTRDCHDCGASPGSLHQPGCDAEQCPGCGDHFASCDCPARQKRRRLPWTGAWPGEEQCRQFGWFARPVPGAGRVPCGEGDPGAQPDLDRLFKEARWDRRAGRFVRRGSVAA
jgi:hypothetical protein